MNDLIQTNLGPMTPAQIADEMTYRHYANQRLLYNVKPETLARYYGDEPARVFAERFVREERERVAANRAAWDDPKWAEQARAAQAKREAQ
jgi:hypothetical protein